MHKFLVILTLAGVLASLQVLADESKWKRIYPVPECQSFHLLWQKNKNNYYITYPVQDKNGKKSYFSPYITVKSLNDLSSLADVVDDQVSKKCQKKLVKSHGEKVCNTFELLDDSFIDLIQDASRAVSIIGDDCREITRYLELHDKIEKLDSSNPISIKKASNFGNWLIKIFADSTNDKLVDHFEACGGKDASNRFIENLLLIESHNNCIMPAPPGILSWDQMRKIAKNISSKHRNKSILKIREQTEQIEKETLMEITKVASVQQIGELVPGINAAKTLERLESYKKLKANKNMNDLKEYIQLVYTPNVAMELAEISLHHLVTQEMTPKLPKDWGPKEKQKYINNTLIPKARVGFNECMNEARVRTNYKHKADGPMNLNYRKWLKNEFCKDNIRHCRKAERYDCHSPEPAPTINLLSMNPRISDADLAKSCVLNGIVRTLQPILDLTIESQVAQYKEDVKLPDNMAERFTDIAWKEMSGCINTHPIATQVYEKKDTYEPIFYGKNKTNSFPLALISPEGFTKVLADCSDKVEDKITTDFVEAVFIANENVHESYNYGPIVEFHGGKYHAEAVVYTQKTVKKIMDKCFDRQNLFHPKEKDFRPNPTLCTPLLEMEVASQTIINKLRDTFNDNSVLYEINTQEIIGELKTCTKNAKTRALSAIGNPKATPTLYKEHEGVDYLDRDNSFYQCVENALVSTSKIVSGVIYKNKLIENKKKMSNYSQIVKWAPEVESIVSSCYQSEMNRVNSWSKFKKKNEEKFLDKVEDKCSDKANEYIIPKILTLEAKTKLKELYEDNLLKQDSESAVILVETSEDIRKKFKIEVPSDLKGQKRIDFILGKGIKAFELENPGEGLKEYLTYFEDVVTNRAVDKIHDHIIVKIQSEGKRKHNLNLKELDTALPNRCILDLYRNLKDEFAAKPDDDDPMNLDEIVDQLVDGFAYLKKVSQSEFDNQLKKVSAFCKNTKKYKTLKEVLGSGIFDMVVKVQVQQKVIESFEKSAKDTRDEELKLWKRHPEYKYISSFIEKKYQDTLKVINSNLKDTKKFDKIMFPTDPSPIARYALDNLDEIEDDNSVESIELNRKVVEQLFKERSKKTFAYDFAKINIVNTIGIQGYFDAKVSLWNKAQAGYSFPDKIYEIGMKYHRNSWSPATVHTTFGWDELPDSASGKMIDAMYINAVIPSIDDSMSIKEKNSKNDILTKVVATHVNEYPSKDKSFSAKYSKIIESNITNHFITNPSDIAGAVGEATGEFIYRFGNKVENKVKSWFK